MADSTSGLSSLASLALGSIGQIHRIENEILHQIDLISWKCSRVSYLNRARLTCLCLN